MTAKNRDALPVAPSLSPTLARFEQTTHRRFFRRFHLSPRVLGVSAAAMALAVVAAYVALGLTRLIAFFTNVAFYGRASTAFVSPWEHRLGAWVIAVPVAGALIVGAMARFGSAAIRGHGIPEAMEQVLFNRSRIPARMTWLKPLSAAVAIGTGGPFGAEGPIIATGGALGSLVGQLTAVTAAERKTLLAAGAAAGMSATFASPVSAVLLAIELLLFEYRPRSLIPVALASATAAAVRTVLMGSGPAFTVAAMAPQGIGAIAVYTALGAIIGGVAIAVTRAVYGIEDLFEKLPLHWMWWPAIGGLCVGLCGYAVPRTLGVGYENIEALVGGEIAGRAALTLVAVKFVSWSVALASGTSGGTLAPLFTLGAGCGALFAEAMRRLSPGLSLDARVAALVGMAAMFAGASRALLASVVFAFETTRQFAGFLPLLSGCSAAYLVSCLLMRHTIMTEKMARRGARISTEYAADALGHLVVGDFASKNVVTLSATQTLGDVQTWMAQKHPDARHQGFPVLSEAGALIGVLTRRDLLDPDCAPGTQLKDVISRPPLTIFSDQGLREAADLMVHENVGRLVVVTRAAPGAIAGLLTRGDLLAAERPRLEAERRVEATFKPWRIS